MHWYRLKGLKVRQRNEVQRYIAGSAFPPSSSGEHLSSSLAEGSGELWESSQDRVVEAEIKKKTQYLSSLTLQSWGQWITSSKHNPSTVGSPEATGMAISI